MASKKLRKELKQLVRCLKNNGYTNKQIKEIKHIDNANTIADYIDNLQEEQCYWE